MDRGNPFLFKQNGELDLSQVFLAILVLWVVIAFTLNGLGILTFTAPAYAFWGSFLSLAFIAWAARDRAVLIAQSRSAPPPPATAEPVSRVGNLWTDDERGEFPDRDYA